MPWDRRPGTRRALPRNWGALVAQTRKKAGGQCEAIMPSGHRCPRKGSECHHSGDPTDHTALQWLCTRHHAIETARQAAAAKSRTTKRQPKPHPGSLR
ncbi:MAG: hypothetical protein M3Q39_15985 [Actinomycetota bacterium]|nr:hypothetical protein [Actinomycetota bacterium]